MKKFVVVFGLALIAFLGLAHTVMAEDSSEGLQDSDRTNS
jgi:hypothetical protein